MAVTAAPRRPGLAARRFGYVVAVLVSAVLLYAANRWPGWSAVPFLTSDTRVVMPFVNASIVVGIAANLVYLVHDPRWLRGLGDVVTTSVGLLAVVRVWQVFPFDFGAGPWVTLARILLAVAIAGSVIGIVAGLVAFVRSSTPRPR